MNLSWNTIAAAIGLGNYIRPSNGSRHSSRNLPLRNGRPGEDALPSPPASSREPPSSAAEHRSRRAPAGTRQQGTSRNAEIIQRNLQYRVEELALELDRAKRELSLTKQELESTRLYTNMADAISETDILQKLSSLNDVVYQVASTIAEAHETNAISVSTDTQRGTAAQFTIAEAHENHATSTDRPSKRTMLYDESLCSLVGAVRRKPTHARVLVSLQACMNHFCAMVLSSEFSSIVNRERTELLQKIFDDMKASQPKAVSARWRSLAYSHNNDLTQDQQQLHQLLGSNIRTLYGFPKEKFESMFGQELSELVTKTLDLRKMMYGEYVSGDVEVFSPVPGSQFDPGKMQVDDPRKNGRSSADGPIKCTTTMGIGRKLYIRRFQADRWGDEEEYNVLGKASVLISFDD